MIPVLFTTYNRLEFTKQSLPALLNSECKIIIIDNASTDGTQEYLRSLKNDRIQIILNNTNEGVRGAMNQFFDLTKENEWVGKVDNDTIVSKDWLSKLLKVAKDRDIDIVQAKHPILKATHPSGSFDEWMKELPLDPVFDSVYYNNYVGGSGILIRRSIIEEPLPDVGWVLGGWNDFQTRHTEIKKAFCTDVEITLLDADQGKYQSPEYKEYYLETGRAKVLEYHKFGEEPEEYLLSRTYKQFEEDLKTEFDFIIADDGHIGQIKAFQMLKERGIRGMLSITTGFLGKEGYMTWKDVEELSKDHEIINHTVNHLHLTELPEEQVRFEIETAQKEFEAHGIRPRYFIPPWNQTNPLVDSIYKELGLKLIRGRLTITKNTYEI